MISFIRIDNRLIHGQVVETWLPQLKVRRLVVADDEAAGNVLMRAAMGLAVPDTVDVLIQSVDETDFTAFATDAIPTLLLFRDIEDLFRAQKNGLAVKQVNVGNVHFSLGRKKVTPSVFLSEAEFARLKAWEAEGAEVEARAVPSDQPLSISQMEQGA